MVTNLKPSIVFVSQETAVHIPGQTAITGDNVQVWQFRSGCANWQSCMQLHIDGVLYFRIFDAAKASYGVDNLHYAITQLAQTTMRYVVELFWFRLVGYSGSQRGNGQAHAGQSVC